MAGSPLNYNHSVSISQSHSTTIQEPNGESSDQLINKIHAESPPFYRKNAAKEVEDMGDPIVALREMFARTWNTFKILTISYFIFMVIMVSLYVSSPYSGLKFEQYVIMTIIAGFTGIIVSQNIPLIRLFRMLGIG